MMQALVDDAGHYRRGGVGVFGEKGLVHLAPPADRVPMLMGDLFDWLKHSKDHLLIRSCVFHYEFEFIHPFTDGNGRTGRLWQSLILGKLHLPNQQAYYDAITASTSAGQSGPFIDFMLNEIFHTLKEHQGEPLPDKVPNKLRNKYPELSDAAWDVYTLIKGDSHTTSKELGATLGISDRMVRKYISLLREANLIVRMGSNKTGYWKVLMNKKT